MKKSLTFLIALGLAGITYIVYAEMRGSPTSQNGTALPPLYGGAEYSVLIGTVSDVQAFTGRGVVMGVSFSTGLPTDFVVFRDTNTANHISTESLRIYNIAQSTCGPSGASGAPCATFLGPNYLSVGHRMKYGCSWTVGFLTSTYNAITVHYYQEK